MQNNELISTGLESLDDILNFLLPGDNVVWNTPSTEEYKTFVTPYVSRALADNRTVHYIRFAQHPPVIDEDNPNIIIHRLDPDAGFENFAKAVHEAIRKAGEGSFFVFDSLSSLLSHWAADSMVGNFFLVTCPLLYKIKAIAYFALLKNDHSINTIKKIKSTTQLFLEIYNYDGVCYVHPQKVFGRSSPTMFLPHKFVDDKDFLPVVNSVEATSLFYSICSVSTAAQKKLDSWDRTMLLAKELVSKKNTQEQEKVLDKICRYIIGRDERIISLVKKHFTIRDMLEIKSRMIGTGYIGGKATGMLLAMKIIQNSGREFANVIEQHDSYYVGSNVFHSYIIHNGWWDLYMEHRTKKGYHSAGEELGKLMLEGEFPEDIAESFRTMLDYFGQYPIVVRSSSILEDGFGNAFAGKYESFFCSVQGSPEVRFEEFLFNLKRVYASTMCHDALEYREKKGLAESDEQMGILIQRVSGAFHGYYYYPHVAGVGLSYNTYVWHDDIEPEAGMLRLVGGLGTRAVNRVKDDYPRIVALNAPEMMPLNDMNDVRKFSQRMYDVLDTRVSGKNAISLYELYDKEFPYDLNKIAAHDREAERMLAERGRQKKDIWILTFDRLLKQTDFPDIMKDLMNILEDEYGCPVDIEFTLNFQDEGAYNINIVQCRPHQTSIISDITEIDTVQLNSYKKLFQSKSNFMGGNVAIRIQQVVIIDSAAYLRLGLNEKYSVAKAIKRINKEIEPSGRNTMLLGPGRWGTSTPTLGVPVSFADINHMKVIGEVAFEEGGLMPELSFGSHFFQDLVESDIFYVALFPHSYECSYRNDVLDNFNNCFADEVPDMKELKDVVKLYRFDDNPLILKADIKSQDLTVLIDANEKNKQS